MLSLGPLRELEEQLRAALDALAQARGHLDEGKPTQAAVELDAIELRLGIGREAVHDLLEGAGHAVDRTPASRRARLAPVLAAWRDDARRACTAHGVELALSLEPDGHFELDAVKLRRLLSHLVSAGLARGSGPLELRCSVEAAGPSRALLTFEVARQRTRRLSEATAAELLARRLALVLGGRLETTLGPGEPMAVLRAAVPARILPAREPCEPVRLAGARVLVVEDDEDARAALEMLLEDWELDVVSAGTYEDALGGFAKGDVRLALLDVDLNGRSGFELYHELSALAPALPAIFLSGSDSRRGLAEGPLVRYLVKPVDLTALEASIRDLLVAARLPLGG
jgi:two-component system CheB/CheR fusion protein